MELRIETYERLPPVVTGDTPVVTGGLRWVSSTGLHLLPFTEREFTFEADDLESFSSAFFVPRFERFVRRFV